MDEIRLGVVGLGMMGRNHVRVAERLEGVALIGGVDPEGDRHRSLYNRPVFSSFDQLLAEGVEAVVISVPSDCHEQVALEAAAAGVHVLVEKPLGMDIKMAMRIRDAFAGSGLVAGVGHVERFNPAIVELRKRLLQNELGRILAINTRRVGPYPLRISDVGVVYDLATHDIDLLQHVGGPIGRLKAEVATRLGHHEDLIEAVGRQADEVVISMSVNWLTPMKQRTVTVLGERGALHADLLTSDLTFYTNSATPVEWDEMARLKGVSEGDMIRYAIRKVEPLRAELEAFRDSIKGQTDSPLASMDEGLGVVRIAEMLVSDGTFSN